MGYCIYLRKGETHTAPSSGILASDLAVGDIVKLTESGTSVEYIVVNQGIPTGGESLYDSSCDGTWLLRKDCSLKMIWHKNTNVTNYDETDIYSWLNNSYILSLGAVEQNSIKQVNIPYCYIFGTSQTIKQISGKAFLLSSYEIGGKLGFEDGKKLSYFESGDGTTALNKRIAKYEGETISWWTRTTFASYKLVVDTDGTFVKIESDIEKYVRPALILPSTAKFDKDTKILKG